jgi:hypothetical protein
VTAPAEPVYWESVFQGSSPRIFKALYGSFLIRDWGGPATSLKGFNPFDVDGTGDLRNDLIGFGLVNPAEPFDAVTNPYRQGWRDPGYLDENGIAFSPKYTTVDTMVWQSRMAQRTDVTLDQEQLNAVFVESNPILDALNWQLPIGQNDLVEVGQVGYEVLKPLVPQQRYRQILCIGVDGSTGDNEYFATSFSRTLMTKPDKYDMQAKKELQTNLTYDSYPDPSSGWAVARWREGPAWRASGGSTSTLAAPVATATAAGTATLEFAPPTSPNGPWTYAVTRNVAGVLTPVPANEVTVSSQSDTSVVLTVTGQPAGAAKFRVQAVGSNNSMSAPSDDSNSVTIT